MSNLTFYERAIALRERYENERDSDKILILNQIVPVAFQHHEELPAKFHFSLPTDKYSLSFNLKVSEVLIELGCKESLVNHYGDSQLNDFTLFFVKQIDA